MIRYRSNIQLSIEEFKTPFGIKLSADNRWVKLAKMIPWDELASIYYRSMSKRRGAPSLDARIVLGALIIKHMLVLDDRGTIEIICENPYMQYFLGLEEYTDKPIFDASLFVKIRRRLGDKEFDLMNEQILRRALNNKSNATVLSDTSKDTNKDNGSNYTEKTAESNDRDVDSKLPKNQGQLKIDATVANADIKYPTDVELVNDCRKKSEELIDSLYEHTDLRQKPRTYRRKADQIFLTFSKTRKKNTSLIRKTLRFELNCLKRNLKTIEALMKYLSDRQKPNPLSARQWNYYHVLHQVAQQQEAMLKSGTHRCENRIVNIHQPHVRPIVRGKTSAPVEFGAKINVSKIGSFARISRLSWDAYNEAEELIPSVERYKDIFGYYPELVQVDRIYLNRENRRYLKEHGIRYTGKALGRPKEEPQTYYEKRKAQKEAAQRNQIEGLFGLSKRKFRLNRIYAKTKQTAESWIAAILFVCNLAAWIKHLTHFFVFLYHYSIYLLQPKKCYQNIY